MLIAVKYLLHLHPQHLYTRTDLHTYLRAHHACKHIESLESNSRLLDNRNNMKKKTHIPNTSGYRVACLFFLYHIASRLYFGNSFPRRRTCFETPPQATHHQDQLTQTRLCNAVICYRSSPARQQWALVHFRDSSENLHSPITPAPRVHPSCHSRLELDIGSTIR
jgi:hypothetical protein